MTSIIPFNLLVISVAVAGLVFIFDLLLPLGVAGGVPYIALVLLGTWYPRVLHLYVLAAVGTALTIVGFFLSPAGGIPWVVMTNRALALFAIWITAFLIANRKRAEKNLREKEIELRRVSRMSDMGQIASALAHEINQPLTAISIYIQATQRMLERMGGEVADKIYENLDKAVAQSGRANQIVHRLRQFIDKGEVARTEANISNIVAEACDMALFDAAGKGIEVRKELDGHLPLVLVDKIQIQQVVVNLLRNSVDALTESGRRELTVTTSQAENDAVAVTVHDTGPGLSDEVSEQLFKPFVTTKANGMGVGLSICHSILDEHDGRIWATPNEGGGTSFHFTLPIAARETSDHDD